MSDQGHIDETPVEDTTDLYDFDGDGYVDTLVYTHDGTTAEAVDTDDDFGVDTVFLDLDGDGYAEVTVIEDGEGCYLVTIDEDGDGVYENEFTITREELVDQHPRVAELLDLNFSGEHPTTEHGRTDIDTSGVAYVETYDKDGDGRPDALGVHDEDGFVVAEDSDGDGGMDRLTADLDDDGHTDVQIYEGAEKYSVYVDKNDNGSFDDDGNGEADDVYYLTREELVAEAPELVSMLDFDFDTQSGWKATG